MRRYLAWYSWTFAFLVLASAIMNVIVDPYLVYRIGPNDLNAGKRQQDHWISRAETAARDGFDVLIAGDSRALNGFSPDHPSLRSYGRAYNIAVAGASLLETQNLLQVALDSPRPPRLILWSVPCAPGLMPDQIGDDFEWSRAGHAHSMSERHSHYLLSLHASNDSIHALGCLVNGHSYGIEQGFKAHPRLVTTYDEFMACIPKLAKPLTQSEIDERLNGARTTIGSVAARCQHTGTQLVIVFPPIHASFLRGISTDGGWEVFQGQKTVAVELAHEINRTTDVMQVWDFTAVSGVNDEPVAAAGYRPLNWYLDASHFNRKLGDEVLSKIFKPGSADAESQIVGFGKQLTADNLRSHLAQQSREIEGLRRGPTPIANATDPTDSRQPR